MKNPFKRHDDGDTMQTPQPPDHPGELLDPDNPSAMPDPNALQVPDHPGELSDQGQGGQQDMSQGVQQQGMGRQDMDPDAGRDPGADQTSMTDRQSGSQTPDQQDPDQQNPDDRQGPFAM